MDIKKEILDLLVEYDNFTNGITGLKATVKGYTYDEINANKDSLLAKLSNLKTTNHDLYNRGYNMIEHLPDEDMEFNGNTYDWYLDDFQTKNDELIDNIETIVLYYNKL